ncbi:hypothetical protein WME98_49930 [Sorangium sp. So ce296]|uniref:hypothetical protein n=1 Tax=Sorangium sp. So ce296 TaxID=3133296 RepID=UPI003F5DABB7
MSMHRFLRKGPDAADLNLNYLPAGVSVAVMPLDPPQTCDMFLSDDAALGDLKQAVAKEWQYVGLVEPVEEG